MYGENTSTIANPYIQAATAPCDTVSSQLSCHILMCMGLTMAPRFVPNVCQNDTMSLLSKTPFNGQHLYYTSGWLFAFTHEWSMGTMPNE